MVLKEPPGGSRTAVRELYLNGATGAAYVLVGVVSLAASYGLDGAMIVWPPAGVALAAVVLFGPSVWIGIAAGAFLLRAIGV